MVTTAESLQLTASLTKTVYVIPAVEAPADKLVATGPAPPVGDQLQIKGEVPVPVFMVTDALPVLVPKQSTLLDVVLKTGDGLLPTIVGNDLMQPMASLTEMVYAPGARAVAAFEFPPVIAPPVGEVHV